MNRITDDMMRTRKKYMAAIAQAQSGNDADLRRLMQDAEWTIDCLRNVAGDRPEAARFLFRLAQRLTQDIMHTAKATPPPAWLQELAAKEIEVPWMMTNGKPAPGFIEADAVLRWGHGVVKRGKSQFLAPQTRAVADAVHSIESMRPMDRRMKYATLPPLSKKTRAQWWRRVRVICRMNIAAYLTAKDKENIRATLDYPTDTALVNEWLKRCRIAFGGLCPNG